MKKKYKIIIFAKGEAPKQAENLKWYSVVWLKFKVPQLHYEDRIEIEKDTFGWHKAKELIRKRISRHISKTFARVEYEEEF